MILLGLQGGSDAALSQAIDQFGSTLQPVPISAMNLLNSYAPIFLAAFLVTLLVTPLVRWWAEAADVTDRPDPRKAHLHPVPNIGGVAVFLGLLVAVAISYVYMDGVAARYHQVPMAVVLGMAAIMFTGLADDVWGLGPRLKIAGQLVAAAALAIQDVGVRVAAGMLQPVAQWVDPILGTDNLVFTALPAPWGDLVYWVGTGIIAVFVLGGCNAANLIDGLDGLLSGVVGIVAVGLVCISVLMALSLPVGATESESLAGARMVLGMALLGAVLGFLPHNFNPANIFLGDCGSLLLGYLSVVIILMFGEHGQTHLVFAGLVIFSVPIMDTMLAIIRRRLAGTPMSAADDQHIHHQLLRSLGGVRRAVFAMYGISVLFAIVGVLLAALVMKTELRVRIIYAIALVLFAFVGVIAVKSARRHRERLVAEGKTLPVGSPPKATPTPSPGSKTAGPKPGTAG
ncbi:MAG: glycosyltransferase family 4 protein [Planctomycetota bacterium]